MTSENYIEYRIEANEAQQEMLAAMLDDSGYEGFIQETDHILVYIPESLKNESSLTETLTACGLNGTFRSEVIPPRNWNKEWESGFQPVAIADKIYIRASFHPPQPGYPYDILVQPKMSFGTGHHDTTASVMELMLHLELHGKEVFDYGCGTAILSVLASKLGAAHIFCNDIDDWIEENVQENLTLNQIQNVTYAMGDISLVAHKQFDVILANINRNVLLDSFEAMNRALKPGGTVIISGFYTDDISTLQAQMPQHWSIVKQVTTANGWTALQLNTF